MRRSETYSVGYNKLMEQERHGMCGEDIHTNRQSFDDGLAAVGATI